MSAPRSAGDEPKRLMRTAVHMVGFALCIGLLLWLIHRTVTDPETRDELISLADAPRGELAVLLALTAASMFLNGLTFWLIIRRVRPIPHSDVQAVNGVAYLMANLPMRFGLIFRVAVHHRRNRLPLLTIGGWMAATAVVMGIGLAPPLLAGIWRSEPDVWWWGVSLGGMTALAACVVLGARFFSTGHGWRLIDGFAERHPGALISRIIRSDSLSRLHEGVRMLADPATVAAAVAVRAFDMLVQGLRFMVAASVLGIALPLDQAVLLTIVYFTVDSIAPTGSLGLKEAATAMFATAVGEKNMDATVLTVTAAEIIVRFAGAGLGAIWLRPDRLFPFRRRSGRHKPKAVRMNGTAGAAQRTADDPTPPAGSAAACSDSPGFRSRR